MKRAASAALLLASSVVLVGSGSTPGSEAGRSAQPPAQESHRQFLDTYCASCHNDRLRTAGLTLSGLEMADPGASAELWEKVLYKLRTGQMPPAGRPQPRLPCRIP